MRQERDWNEYLKLKIPVGALVRVAILEREPELGIVLEYNYGLVRNSWYLVYGLESGRSYTAFPNEVEWLRKEDYNNG